MTGDERQGSLSHGANDQAAHFEGGGADDTEEVNELDDDELNELLARGDHELEIFARMDAERLAAREEAHRLSKSTGPMQSTLMEHSELPAFYRRDLGVEMAEALVNEEEAGRGRRARNAVQYNTDLMSDDAWLRANYGVEDDEAAPPSPEETPEPEDPAELKRQKAIKRQERKMMNEQLKQAEMDGMPLAATSIKIKPFGAAAAGGEQETASASTKKGKRPRVSATPSVQGDDTPLVCSLIQLYY